MKKLVVVVGMIVAAVVVLRLLGPKLGAAMERKFEDMPDDFPPKWMFQNITAIRENTERLIELVEAERAEAAQAPESPPHAPKGAVIGGGAT